MTQSKIIVQMLNHHGHGISYDDVQREDTLQANQQFDENYIVIPSNIKPEFLHMLQLIIGIELLIQ